MVLSQEPDAWTADSSEHIGLRTASSVPQVAHDSQSCSRQAAQLTSRPDGE